MNNIDRLGRRHGGGMANVSEERRLELAQEHSERVTEQKKGWPAPVARFGDPLYYEKAEAEFSMRMMRRWDRSHD